MDTTPFQPKTSVKTPRIRQFFRKDYSHIDSVTSSLENLVFSDWREEQKAIHKKRFFIGIISFILLTGFTVVISPKSKAEVATFYPTSCLGGWSNPHKAENKPETIDGITTFNLNNSALLSSESIADLYCGSFKGEVPTSTTPTKMILTIVWNNLPNEDIKPIVSDSFASSTLNILDATSSVDFTLASSSTSTSTTSTTTESSADILTSTTTDTNNNEDNHTEVASSSTENTNTGSGASDANSTQNESTTNNVLETPTENTPQTESAQQTTETKTEEIKEPTPSTSADTSSPQSYLYKLGQKIIASLISSVYALDDSMISSSSSTEINDQNNTPTNTNTSTETENASDYSTSTDISAAPQKIETMGTIETQSTEPTNQTNETSSTTTIESSSSTNDIATTTDSSVSESTSTESSNPIFEIFYTLNGNDWVSLGKVNINNFSFNKFEIPLATSSNWADISNIQIKIESLNTFDKKPPVFVDGMILDVNYDKNVNNYEEKADPKSYDIILNSTNGDLETGIIDDSSQGKTLSIQSKTGGSLTIYKEKDDNPVYNSGLGGDPLLVNSYIFDPGDYIIVLTNKEDGCSGLSANDCVKAKGFTGSASFTISPTFNTPLEYVHIK